MGREVLWVRFATTTTPLPATGGLLLVPLAGASLLVLGLAGYAIKRRIS